MSLDLFKRAETIFWDFDGVIKESVEIKSDAFEELFFQFGEGIAKKVRRHHEENGGMSRFDKFPIYLGWGGQEASQQIISQYSQQFSDLVMQRVIDADWVPGVKNYLKNNYNKQKYFLITATPQKEIEYIIQKLNIRSYFNEVIGSPVKKIDAMTMLLSKYSIPAEKIIVIGDSISDYEAAVVNQLPFVLRRTNFNLELQEKLKCIMITDFHNE